MSNQESCLVGILPHACTADAGTGQSILCGRVHMLSQPRLKNVLRPGPGDASTRVHGAGPRPPLLFLDDAENSRQGVSVTCPSLGQPSTGRMFAVPCTPQLLRALATVQAL